MQIYLHFVVKKMKIRDYPRLSEGMAGIGGRGEEVSRRFIKEP